ncbi:hypothetical protein B0F90DRAFT_1822542 [Multifurca ochricompacta]|uniref:Uncharacterized protein n=1 Tax=Multifurca ochricompacta TaxID=376703 RepID=A0AAD4QIM6_9AGAM|nr:hypothetical protein B0F90DRAFT_1822542 [Multifurca ochricompacta]
MKTPTGSFAGIAVANTTLAGVAPLPRSGVDTVKAPHTGVASAYSADLHRPLPSKTHRDGAASVSLTMLDAKRSTAMSTMAAFTVGEGGPMVFYEHMHYTLANGMHTKIAMSVSVRIEGGRAVLPTDSDPGNHWATLILDIKMLSILYGDSYKLPPPVELRNVLHWCANAMAHALLPTLFPLMPEDGCISAWMDMLIQIVSYWKRTNLEILSTSNIVPTPVFKFQMTIPQQTMFSPVVPQRNTPKSAFKAQTQTLTSSGFHMAEAQQNSAYSKKRSITPPPHLPKKHEKASHAPPIAPPQANRYEPENSDTNQHTTPTRANFDATREKLETEHIVSEAENVMAKQLQYLWTQENLTVSCDGGTMKGGEAFWTIHVSTPNRKVYLMECREATSESHTGVWIKDVVLETVNTIGHPRISAVVPTALNLADIIHHINNTLKDIVKLPYFQNTIKTVHAVITKFHTTASHLATAELKAVLTQDVSGDASGI